MESIFLDLTDEQLEWKNEIDIYLKNNLEPYI